MSIYYGASGDVRAELGSPTETEVSASLLDLGRKKATALVDSFLEAAYPSNVPFASAGDVPAIIDSITNDFACYYIYRSKTRGLSPVSAEVKEEYWDKPMELLKSIQKGEVALPELTSSLDAEVDANRKDYHPVFDVDAPESAVIDEDLLDDVADDRE